ncbi:MAG: dienelactone hydrolase family protein [Microthrixaceae bacterium]|nr:dienelactone hydrolase family protein [Microthrixaceae bacterium]
MALGGLVLFPGAGSGADHPSLLAIESAVSPLPVRRVDFVYRRAGRRFPDRAPKLIVEVAAAVEAAAERWNTEPSSLVIGGRSMGGRMASMAIAEGAVEAAGLVLVSYPLHPPGKPDRLRVEHLGDVGVPTLFVSGNRDTFGTPDELAAAHELVGGPVTVEWIEGGRHELKRKADNADVAGRIAGWLDRLRR